uniref:PepSY domain-containing protein n=1 Tax=Gelidibacter sp. TaxID=2018083 RepID=UPI00404981A2
MEQKLKSLAKATRWYRKTHRFVAISLVAFLFVMGATGLLLAWKDELKLKPPTSTIESNGKPLISLDSIKNNAITHIENLGLSSEIDRIDYRPNKGIAKVVFVKHFTELQVDCYSGKIISEKKRTADVIEMIHDGSILDFLFKNSSKPAKLFYSTLTSLGLMFLAFSGFWLWLKPRQIKKLRRKAN